MDLRALVIALCLLLTACAIRGPATPVPAQGRVVLVRPFVSTPRSAQALVETKTVLDIATLYVVPWIEQGDGTFRLIPLRADTFIPGGDTLRDFTRWSEIVFGAQHTPWVDLDRPIALTGLKAHARYRITALAFDRSMTLISKEGAPSSIELSLGDDDAPSVETPLPVELVDTPFGAQATVQLSVTGNLSRLDRLEVSLKRLSEGLADPLTVATASVPAKQLPHPLRFSHLRAHTRYAVVVAAHVTDGGSAPQPQTLEFDVGHDDRLPDLEAAIAVP